VARSPSRVLKLQYVGDASSLTKANAQAESGLEKLGNTFAKVGKAVAVGVAAAGAALGVFAKKAIDSAIEAEAAQTRLATILSNTGLATEEQVKALNNQAAALEKVGVASASNITVLQAQLATFDMSAETIKTLTPAIVDYVIAEKGAAASASDFQSAANGLAQALQGNFASLSRTGFVLDEVTKELITNGTEAERAAALVEVLGSTYEGFNEVARTTAEGQLVALRNAFDSLKETIGFALLPVFRDLVAGASTVVDKFQELWEIHGPAIIERFNRIVDRAKELYEQFKKALPEALDFLRDKFGDTGVAVLELATYLRELFTEILKELKERKAFAGLREEIRLLGVSADTTLGKFNEMIRAFSGGDVEKSASVWSTLIELYEKPLLRLTESFRTLIEVIGQFFSVIGAVRKLPDTLRGFASLDASGFDVEELARAGTLQGAIRGTQPIVNNININGTLLDAEGTARNIEKVLNEAYLRRLDAQYAGVLF